MLQIEDASIAYGNDVLFSNFNLQLKRGEIASISGSSGCGKHLFSMPYWGLLH